MPRGAGTYLIGGHPQRAHDAVVELAVRLECAHGTGECKAQVGDVFIPPRARHVDADQGGRCEVMGGFLQRFADAAFGR